MWWCAREVKKFSLWSHMVKINVISWMKEGGRGRESIDTALTLGMISSLNSTFGGCGISLPPVPYLPSGLSINDDTISTLNSKLWSWRFPGSTFHISPQGWALTKMMPALTKHSRWVRFHSSASNLRGKIFLDPHSVSHLKGEQLST